MLSTVAAWCTLLYLPLFPELLRSDRLVCAVLLFRNAILVAMLVELTRAISGSDASSAPDAGRKKLGPLDADDRPAGI